MRCGKIFGQNTTDTDSSTSAREYAYVLAPENFDNALKYIKRRRLTLGDYDPYETQTTDPDLSRIVEP
jgi:hypothetical protein